jgi:hypothetical protein
MTASWGPMRFCASSTKPVMLLVDEISSCMLKEMAVLPSVKPFQ